MSWLLSSPRPESLQVAYLPIPSSAIRTDPSDHTLSQIYLPSLEEYLSRAPQDLDVHLVCCLTRHFIAGEKNAIVLCQFNSWEKLLKTLG